MKNKKIAVTGGLGFIGSHLVEELCTDNLVVVVDNESTGSMDNIKHLQDGFIDLDLGDINEIDLEATFDGCDYVFHQAALPSVPRSIKDPLKSNEANVTGTLKVLISARDAGVKKVVFASSSSVYGDTPILPKVEDMPVNPKSPYAVTKATGEYYCKVFEEVYGLKTASLRYFNVFGPRQDPESQYAAVIPKFIQKMLKGEKPVIFGDGEQSRDFTFIKNVVEANILAAQSQKGGVFNVACGRRFTLNELVEYLNEILNTALEAEYAKPRSGDIKHSLADIERARSLGYNPQGDFKEELKQTAEHFL
ncbi:MAG: SDR family oxidoreductase [Euryarchaeota archaeon]